MFSRWKTASKEDQKDQAKAVFVRATELRSDSREARSMRVRVALLCRAHVDKTFVEAAQRTAAYQDQVIRAAAAGQPRPTPPTASEYQRVATVNGEVMAYLPMEYTEAVFAAGARYQRCEIQAQQAIDLVQAVADQVFRFELRLDEPLLALQFLREEVQLQPGQPAAQGAGEGI